MADKTSNIKTKLSFDGEAQYKAACKEINSTLKVLNSEMKLVTAQYKNNAGSIDALRAKQETLKKTYDEQKKKVEETEKALKQCREATGENSEETKRLETALNYAKIALTNTEGELQETAKEMEELENATDDAGEEIEDTEKKSSKLGETMQKAVVAGLKAMAAAAAAAASAIAAIGAASIKVGAEFETSMAKTSTLFTGTDEELAQLNDDILRISSSTGLAASGLAEAAYSAESAGVAQENLANMLEQSAHLAAAGFTDVETALSATAKTMNAYGDEAGTIEEIQKILIQTQNLGITTVGELGQSLAQVTPTAAAFGVSFDQVGASLAVMTAAGTPTATATTQLNNLIAELAKNGTVAAKNLEEAAKGTEYAGMSFTEMMDAGADLSDVLELLQKSADDSGLSMVDMFSSMEAGKAALSIMSEDGKKFKDDLAEMSTETDVVTEGYNKMMDTFEAKTGVFKTTAQNLGISIYQNMQEPLKEWADVGIDSIQQLQNAFSTDGFEGMVSTLGGILGEVVAKITEQAPRLAESAVVLLQGFGNALVEQIPTITKAAADIALTLVDGLMQMLPTIVDGAALIILSLAVGIGQALPELLPTIVSVVTNIVIILIDNIPMLIDAALQLLTGLADGLVAALPVLIEALPEIITAIIDALIEGIPLIIESAGDIILALIDGLIDAIPLLILAMPQITAAIVKGLITGLPEILSAAGQLVITIVNKLKELPTQILQAIIAGVEKIAEWGASMKEKGGSVTVELVTKVIDTIKELPQKIWNGITDAVTRVATWGLNMQTKAKEVINSMVMGVVNIVKEIPQKIYNSISGAISKVAVWGTEVKNKAVEGMKSVITGITNTFKNIGGTFAGIGKNMVEGIWNGISNATQWIKNKISSWVGSVTDFLKNLFGIASPSKLMRDEIGVYLAQGIGVGFTEEMDSVNKQIEAAIPKEFDVGTKVNVNKDFTYDTDDGGKPKQKPKGGGIAGRFTVIQNIYANTTDYAKQQKEAERRFRMIARTV